MSRIVSFAIAFIGSCFVSTAVMSQDFREVFSEVSPSIGLIYGEGAGMGTGFVISQYEDGLILATNHHVIRGSTGLGVYFRDGEQVVAYEGFIIATDEAMDIALIRARPFTNSPQDETERPPLSLDTDGAQTGQEIAAIGFPGASSHAAPRGSPDQIEPSLTRGGVSRVVRSNWAQLGLSNDDGSYFPIIQHNADISGGNSGGPVISDCGSVVGINTAETPGDTAQGIFYASGAQALITFARENDVDIQTVDAECRRQGAISGSLWLIAGLIVLLLAALAVLSILVWRRPRTISVAPTPNPMPMPGPAPATRAALLVSAASPGGSVKRLGALDETELRKGVTVGRSGFGADALNDPNISRHHARIFLSDRRLMIEDMNSSNGTYVDGKKLHPGKPAQIATQSQITLGHDWRLILERG